jgi:hypothetical protein
MSFLHYQRAKSFQESSLALFLLYCCPEWVFWMLFFQLQEKLGSQISCKDIIFKLKRKHQLDQSTQKKIQKSLARKKGSNDIGDKAWYMIILFKECVTSQVWSTAQCPLSVTEYIESSTLRHITFIENKLVQICIFLSINLFKSRKLDWVISYGSEPYDAKVNIRASAPHTHLLISFCHNPPHLYDLLKCQDLFQKATLSLLQLIFSLISELIYTFPC